MSTEVKEPPAPKGVAGGLLEVAKNMLDADKAVTLRVIDLIPKEQLLQVFLWWLLSLFVIFAGGGFLWKGYATFGFVIVAMGVAGIITAALIPALRGNPMTAKDFGNAIAPQVSGPSWSRVVPKLPIPEKKLDDFQTNLKLMRGNAVIFLNEYRKGRSKPELDANLVRLNVFLVSTEHVAKGEVCGLEIPDKMQVNMNNSPDRHINFRPHEGLTGRTFTLGETGGVHGSIDAQGRLTWERADIFPDRPGSDEWEQFSLSDEQKALIGTRPRWIVSFPLHYPGDEADKTFGVLNIDGLDESLDLDEMRNLAQRIEPAIGAFTSQLAALPKVRIAIRVEDVPETTP
jgi:hypothetical protein